MTTNFEAKAPSDRGGTQSDHDALISGEYGHPTRRYVYVDTMSIETEKIPVRSPSPPTERMRLFRRRRRRRIRSLQFHLGTVEIDALIAKGYLDPKDREDLKVTQETLAALIGTTRSRVNVFLNKFRKLGLIKYNDKLQVQNALLNFVLHEQPHIEHNN